MSVVVGLTGQSGAGKTTVSEVFAQEGFGIVNCDMEARYVTRDGSECCRALAKVFPECFDEKFRMDRRRMADLVFSDRAMLRMLTDIEYPFIRERISQVMEEMSREHGYILLDAPTLFEAGIDRLCFCVVGVTAPYELRRDRIVRRDGIDETAAEKRLASQHSEDFFRERCEYIIENGSDLISAEAAAHRAAKDIKERTNGKTKGES